MATKQLGAKASGANDLVAVGDVGPLLMGSQWMPPKYRPGFWHQYTTTISGGAISTLQGLNEVVYVHPWVVTDAITVTNMSMRFNAQGSPNTCVLRVGVWRHDPATQAPGQLLSELGSYSGGAGNGGTVAWAVQPSMPVNLALQPGMYWYGLAVQGATTTTPQIAGATYTGDRVWDQPLGTSLPAAGFVCGSYYMSGVTGALTDFRVDGITNISPRFTFRVS